MISINPFATLAESVPSIAMQVFALVMVALAAGGTILDIIHKKNVKLYKIYQSSCKMIYNYI